MFTTNHDIAIRFYIEVVHKLVVCFGKEAQHLCKELLFCKELFMSYISHSVAVLNIQSACRIVRLKFKFLIIDTNFSTESANK